MRRVEILNQHDIESKMYVEAFYFAVCRFGDVLKTAR
jgi:hypothetical protein